MPRNPRSERVDAVNPEWPAEDFSKAKPASEVLVGLFGKAQAKEMLKPKRGNRQSAFFKVVVASTVALRDFYYHGQFPFRVQIHRPDRVPVACLS